MNQLDDADFVLVVCTETYYRRFRGHEELGKGKGVDWEGALITQEIYDARSKTLKFVPVMLERGQSVTIPDPLRSVTYYTLTSEKSYQDLYDFLLGQAGVEPGEVGQIKSKPRRTPPPLTFDAWNVPHRNPYFTGRADVLGQLHQALTDDRRAVLGQAIAGLGGIGKTQTAVEYCHRHRDAYPGGVFWSSTTRTARRT